MKPKPEEGTRDAITAPGEQRGSSVLNEARREDDRIYGGSQAQPNVHSTRMNRTANGNRHSNDISVSAPKAVPLYLIAQVVAAEVARHKRALREIHVVGTAGHCYAVTVLAGEAGGDE